MDIGEWRVHLARLIGLAAIACGIIGLVVGLADRTWRLEETSWFTGGTLLAVIAIGLLADHYLQARLKRPVS